MLKQKKRKSKRSTARRSSLSIWVICFRGRGDIRAGLSVRISTLLCPLRLRSHRKPLRQLAGLRHNTPPKIEFRHKLSVLFCIKNRNSLSFNRRLCLLSLCRLKKVNNFTSTTLCFFTLFFCPRFLRSVHAVLHNHRSNIFHLYWMTFPSHHAAQNVRSECPLLV